MAPPEPERADVEMRRRVLNLVNTYPGLHLRELQRRAETSSMLVEYHLNVLERVGLVTSIDESGYRRFFPAKGASVPLGRIEKRWLGLLRQKVPLGITLYLIEHESAIHKDLADVVPVKKSTLTYHLKNMESAGMIARDPPGSGRTLQLADRERIIAILRAYHPTPDLVAGYGDLWDLIFGALRRPTQPDDKNDVP